MFRLNDVLHAHSLPPEETVVLLHTPPERRLAKLLPFLAEASPEVLEAFQAVHSSRPTKTLRKRQYMVSFVRLLSGQMAFAGAFCNCGVEDRPAADICADPAMRRVIDEFGANTYLEDDGVETWPYFNFKRVPALADYVGRIQIIHQGRTYARLAETLDAEIVEFTQASVMATHPPDWRDFIVTGPELRTLPKSWAARLREWRGIYLIVNENDGARYVGAAYGEDNLLGRWRTHVARDRGVTAALCRLNPRNFRFSILERVSPDALRDEVIALEQSWMKRLHTKDHGLNR
ncbi:MAG: GIY-YIG nuclease family protein [Rhodobacteraceae bacterium]|nr:GIY-YIG nuclease family protein [Paracoccaceae bacterium]